MFVLYMEKCIESKEVWKQFPDLPILYVSNFGNVYSDAYSFVDRFGRQFSYPKKEIKSAPNYKGYHTLKISYKGKLYRYRLHRLVAMTFIPNPDNKLEVNHIDGDKSNNNVWNLEWVTRLENQRHAQDIGLIAKKKYFVKDCCICGKLFAGGREQIYCSQKCYNQFCRIGKIGLSREELIQKMKHKTIAEISRECNVSHSTVRRWIDKYGLWHLKINGRKFNGKRKVQDVSV